jgi:hypothetical protein
MLRCWIYEHSSIERCSEPATRERAYEPLCIKCSIGQDARATLLLKSLKELIAHSAVARYIGDNMHLSASVDL